MTFAHGSRRRVRGAVLLLVAAAGFGAGRADAQGYAETMSMLSAQQFYEDTQRRIESVTHDGPTYYLSRDYTLTPEQEAYLEQRRQDDEKLNALRKDPVLMRFVNGYWEYYQSREGAPPGEFCAATYANLHGVVSLSGVDKSWDGGLLTFTGKDIPKPNAFRKIRATLTQTGARPATVEIFNPAGSEAMKGLGTLIFAVPSLKAALSGLLDEQEFAVSIEGREVFRMTWKDGNKARSALRQCLRGR